MNTEKVPIEDAQREWSADDGVAPVENLSSLLDPASWTPGADIASTYARMEQEVRLAVDQERRVANSVRKELLPKIETAAGAGAISGVYRATPEQIAKIHNGLLLNGEVEACDGISMTHETISLTFVQIGVCMVTYNGDQQSWSQRMFRRDFHDPNRDQLTEMIAVLESRRRSSEGSIHISSIARRGILDYAERMFLTRHSTARWKMCQGRPAPFQMLSGAGLLDSDSSYTLMLAGMEILRELLLEHRRFVFIPNDRQEAMLLTIGRALLPLEYAIIDTIEEQIESIERTGHYTTPQRAELTQFRGDVGDAVVRGVFRASSIGPPQIFYAHRDHAHIAALIAIADSVLQEQRSYPVLLDLAQTVCKTTFGIDSYAPQMRIAYTDAGVPWTAIDV